MSEIFDLDPTLRLLPLKDSTTARNGWRDSSKHIRNEAELNKKLARYSQLCEYADTTTPSIRYSHKQGNAEEGEKKINTRMRFAFNLEVDDFIREVRNILSAHGGFCGPTPIQSWRIVRLGWLAYLPPGIDSKAYSKELMRMNGFRYVLALVYTWVNQSDLPNREEFKGFKAWSIYSAATHAEVAAALLQRNLRIDTPKHEFPFCSVVRYVPDAAGVKLSLIGIDAWQCIKDLMSDMRYKHRSVMTESTVSMLVPAIRSAFLPVDTKTELFGTLTFAKMCFSVWAIPHKDEDFEKVKATVESMQPAEDEPPRGMETVAENEMEDGEDEVSKVSETHSRRLGEPQSAKKPTAVDNVKDDTEAEGIWTTVPSSKRKKKGTKRVDIQADDPSPARSTKQSTRKPKLTKKKKPEPPPPPVPEPTDDDDDDCSKDPGMDLAFDHYEEKPVFLSMFPAKQGNAYVMMARKQNAGVASEIVQCFPAFIEFYLREAGCKDPHRVLKKWFTSDALSRSKRLGYTWDPVEMRGASSNGVRSASSDFCFADELGMSDPTDAFKGNLVVDPNRAQVREIDDGDTVAGVLEDHEVFRRSVHQLQQANALIEDKDAQIRELQARLESAIQVTPGLQLGKGAGVGHPPSTPRGGVG